MKVELGVGVSPEDGTIIDVGDCRHRVDWLGSGPSAITYCNRCGSGLIAEKDGEDFCAGCGVRQP